MPTVAIAPHAQPNAFATGRNPSHAVVCVTRGLLDTVNEAELEGVLAHELAHIQHRDMLLMTVTATIAAAISHVAYLAMFVGGRNDDEGGNPVAGLLMIILAPIAAMLIQLAIGRQREFKADAGGAQISGQPLALASAPESWTPRPIACPCVVARHVAPLAGESPRPTAAALFSCSRRTRPRLSGSPGSNDWRLESSAADLVGRSSRRFRRPTAPADRNRPAGCGGWSPPPDREAPFSIVREGMAMPLLKPQQDLAVQVVQLGVAFPRRRRPGNRRR
jgi:hypothetical protein